MSQFSSSMQGPMILPIIQTPEVADAVNLARAIRAGGIRTVEVVLRTPSALDAVRAIRDQLEDVWVGVGTLLNPTQIRQAKDAGAQFLVTPASSPDLLAALQDSGLPFIPGVSSTSDILMVLEQGIREMKFFPAGLSGGPAMLRALAAVFSEASFCPTGGIDGSNLMDYLSLKNVFAVGGSWMTPPHLVASQDWLAVSELCAEVVNLIQEEAAA